MSKLFGIFDYKTPGKGLSKEEAELKGLKGFFTILKEKFWKIVQLNAMYFIVCIPLFVIFYLGSQFIVAGGSGFIAENPVELAYASVWSGVNVGSSTILASSSFWTDFFMRLAIFILLTATPVLAIGPLQAGYSYIMHSFVRSKPVFLTSDFIGKAKSNLKQALAVSFIDLLLTAIIAIDLKIYIVSFSNGAGGFFVTLATCVIIMALIIYIIAHMFIYPLMVTFKMTIKQLYKNSFLLAMISFLPAVGVLIIDLLIIFIPFMLFRNPAIHVLLTLLIIPSLVALANNYFIFPYVKKHMLDPALEMEKTGDGSVS